MIDWEFWRWVGTTAIAVGALVLSVVNTSRAWRYAPHWTAEVSTSDGVVRVWNRTQEDAVEVWVTGLREYTAEQRVQEATYSLSLAEPNQCLEFSSDRWFDQGMVWTVQWRRPRTQRMYLQRFGDPDDRRLRTRLREARRVLRTWSVKGQKQPRSRR